jgi:hypothetical protein
MRNLRRHVRAWPILLSFGLGLVSFAVSGCGTGTPHLQRPLVIPAGTVMLRSIALAEEAIARAKTAGAANVLDARYPLAKAEAYLLNAKEEFMDGDPTEIVDRFAGISLAAANEARTIAERGR